MRDFFNKLGYKLTNFMQGRYGMFGSDSLSNSLIALAVILMFVNIFVSSGVVTLLAYAALIWAVFRLFSKKTGKRADENAKWLEMTSGIRKWYQTARLQWRDRKVKKYLKCSQCKTVLTVPKGKGKIKVRCPKCGHEKIVKS